MPLNYSIFLAFCAWQMLILAAAEFAAGRVKCGNASKNNEQNRYFYMSVA
jgi:hypothetical protein